MARTLNRAMLIGRMGRDPEMRSTTSGKSVCSFSLATNDGYGENETTTWHNVVCWEKTAEFVSQYCGKGTLIYVDGRIQVRKYTAKDGTERTVTEIIAAQVILLGGGKDAPPKRNAAAKKVDEIINGDLGPIGDDLPF